MNAADLPSFDITETLQMDEDIAEYPSMVIEDGHPVILAVMLGDIARGARPKLPKTQALAASPHERVNS